MDARERKILATKIRGHAARIREGRNHSTAGPLNANFLAGIEYTATLIEYDAVDPGPLEPFMEDAA